MTKQAFTVIPKFFCAKEHVQALVVSPIDSCGGLAVFLPRRLSPGARFFIFLHPPRQSRLIIGTY